MRVPPDTAGTGLHEGLRDPSGPRSSLLVASRPRCGPGNPGLGRCRGSPRHGLHGPWPAHPGACRPTEVLEDLLPLPSRGDRFAGTTTFGLLPALLTKKCESPLLRDVYSPREPKVREYAGKEHPRTGIPGRVQGPPGQVQGPTRASHGTNPGHPGYTPAPIPYKDPPRQLTSLGGPRSPYHAMLDPEGSDDCWGHTSWETCSRTPPTNTLRPAIKHHGNSGYFAARTVLKVGYYPDYG